MAASTQAPTWPSRPALPESPSARAWQPPRRDGTYYAGAVYAAQSSLLAAEAANPGSKNAMIILTDGAANTLKNDRRQA